MTTEESFEMSNDNINNKGDVKKSAELIVRNISFKATEDLLKKHFKPYGIVEGVKLLRKPDGKLVGCGFIHYKDVQMANKAIAATNKKEFLGRPIFVSWAASKNKYETNSQELSRKRKHSNSEDNDDIKYISTETEEEAAESEIANKKARINRNARLIVRNVSFKATEESLREHFSQYGTILEVKLLKKPDGKMVGCGFVHFKNVPMAKEALIHTNMKPFLGRPISVDWAVAKNKYMSYIDQQNLALQEDVKKEDDSDDEDNMPPLNITKDDLKEVKDESEDSDSKDIKSEDEDDYVKSESDDENQEDEEDDEDVDEEDDEPIKEPQERKRIKLNDAEDGCTVFITNIPFDIDKDQLRTFVEKFSPVKYALVCIDQLTEHSRGTGFVKFTNSEDAEKFLALEPSQLKIEDQILKVQPALIRDSLTNKKNKKQPKDNRNLYLVKEGVIVAGTKAAVGVSASDMAKRLTLERSKTQMLKNLNRFVSRYRLVVSNLPSHMDDGLLRGICTQAVGSKATITEARVMRDLRQNVTANGKHPSKGYGFVMFTKHEDALACLRKLNNNPDIFDKNNRPIVSFSIEDRTALNARKKRLEKSIANNPTAKNNLQENKKQDWKRKNKQAPDETKFNKGKKNIQNKVQKNKFRARKDDVDEYAGLTAREGTQHNMRSNHKLKAQANVHRQNLKLEKKKSIRSQKLKLATKERIKQPKQKINKNKNKKDNFASKIVRNVARDKNSFSDLVSKYKTKLVGNSENKVKAKWYDN